jgi:ribosome-associated toxin RatA of RatAB toxin-antitoxin module
MQAITPRHRALAGTAGGRHGARRRLAVWVLTALACLPSVAWAASNNEGDHNVAVSEDEGVYTISARFLVSSSPSIVLAVLTDYDGIPRFLPNVRTSRLIERKDRHALVEQEAVVKLMFFSTRIHLLLGIDEEPLAIRFVDRSGKSFARYEGAWTLAERNGQVEITYALTAKPSFEAPGFLIRRLMRRDASDQIQRLREEMEVRSKRTP